MKKRWTDVERGQLHAQLDAALATEWQNTRVGVREAAVAVKGVANSLLHSTPRDPALLWGRIALFALYQAAFPAKEGS